MSSEAEFWLEYSQDTGTWSRDCVRAICSTGCSHGCDRDRGSSAWLCADVRDTDARSACAAAAGTTIAPATTFASATRVVESCALQSARAAVTTTATGLRRSSLPASSTVFRDKSDVGQRDSRARAHERNARSATLTCAAALATTPTATSRSARCPRHAAGCWSLRSTAAATTLTRLTGGSSRALSRRVVGGVERSGTTTTRSDVARRAVGADVASAILIG